jgi:[ribosomal protein S5]-alanine N-acetyltransferase
VSARQTGRVARLTAPVVTPGTMRERDQPVLSAGTVLLRPWVSEDGPAVVEAYADPSIQQWHSQVLDPDEAIAWIAQWEATWRSESDACWAAVDPNDPQVVLGRIALRRIDLAAGVGEIGYWVLRRARGRGVASIATVAVAEWGLEKLGLHRLQLEHSVRNEPSCHVAARAGFALEGTARHALLHADGWHDMHIHARVAEQA